MCLIPRLTKPRKPFAFPFCRRASPSALAIVSTSQAIPAGGYFTHWTLDLPIFDSASGQEMGKIPAGKVGFRGYMAISTNKQVLLAHADREKTTFAGFEDSLSVTDEQWQVWDLSSGKLVVTFPGAVGGSPSLSNSGHLIYASQGQDLRIFSVPTAEK